MTLVCGNFDWNYAELFYYFIGEFTPAQTFLVCAFLAYNANYLDI